MGTNTTNDNGDKARERREAAEALRAYAKEGQLKPDIKNLLGLLSKESDRGAVVLMGSFIEDALFERIVKKLPDLDPPGIKNLIRSGGMLNGFANKITLAHAQGLIDDELVRMLEIIKLMRNASAHSRLPIGFATPALRDVMMSLFNDTNAEELRDSTDPLFLRFAFVVVSGYLFMRISGTSHHDAQASAQGMLTLASHELQLGLAKIVASQKTPTARSPKPDHPDPTD